MMSVRKFTNPSVLASSTQVCSRSDIFGDSQSHGVHASEKDRGVEFGEEVKWLESYLRSSLLYHFEAKESEEGERERPKKRRRKNEDESKDRCEEPNVFEFRLLSSDEQPRRINLQPKPPKIVHVIEPEYEDTPEHAKLREQRAREVAVDFEWVMQQSRLSLPASRNDKKRHKVITLLVPSSSLSSSPSIPGDAPRILVTECLKKRDESASLSLSQVSKSRTQPNPSPHEFKRPLCCPLLRVDRLAAEEAEQMRRKKRKRGAPPPRRRKLVHGPS